MDNKEQSEPIRISRAEAVDIIRHSHKIASATFIKRTTGLSRVMRFRTGVSIGVKGSGLPYSRASKGLIGVYDMAVGQHRSIAIEGLSKLSANGVKYVIED